MKTNYQYPLEEDWDSADIIAVTNLYRNVEEAYENNAGILKDDLISAYARFKQVVPTKAQEKQLDRSFEQVSGGYSIYRTVKEGKQTTKKRVKMSGGH
ncbi:UPF0223 family protein [Secundilactobacillus malefermentans]|uniref:Uncharacterized protein n=1 Tax=Secundilactobacillus malefermentans TaxID=176292 RepID=A0A4R5NLB7_9LACO|nr:UPF0223 family protein [Secundilactobacillus malefermentans]KRM60058.1 hypothetical protein FD44_GL000620 [Secundilactobacillus malefermentans DSM 5705 = KCTC 3548]QEA30833.1 UPF0223 family protein [Secundilactobacillus malefermentans]TDG75140.1 hypothetical protein C5L31_001017 [Secundilactobacillus malefermentans]